MTQALLEVRGLHKRFGALAATDGVNLDIRAGEIHALIGPNGAGKSTLCAQLAGELAPDSGDILFEGQTILSLSPDQRVARGLVRSFQITSIFRDITALANVALAVQALQGHSFRFWKPAASDRSLTEPALAALERVGLADQAQTLAASLSYGQQRQLELAMALATQPKLLILDEPLAGMGPEDGMEAVKRLKDLRASCTMLLIEHDMEAVFALADRISVLVYGRVIATGTVAEIRRDKNVQRAYLGDEHGLAEADHA